MPEFEEIQGSFGLKNSFKLRKCVLFWVNWKRHTTNSALHKKRTKPTLCNCNFTPQRQYFETFVLRNPLIRDEILFLALFRGADQVYFLRYKHTNHFSALACRPLHQKRLGQEFMRYNLRTFEFKHFWILFQIFDKLPAPLEINSQMTATCLAHTLFF